MWMKEYLWVLEVAFQCWLEHSSVFTALSWPLFMVHGRLLITDISTMTPFGPGAKSLSWPFSTIYGSHLNSIFSPGNRPVIAFSSVTPSTLCNPSTSAHQPSLSISNSLTFVKLMSFSLGCHPTMSSSVVPFSYCLQSFWTSGSFLMSQFLVSGGQSIGASASTSVLPVNIQDWFPLELTELISFQSQGLSRVISNTMVQKHQIFGAEISWWSNSHIHTWLLENP